MNVSVDLDSDVPPFEQVRLQLAAQVASGELAAGTKLATVRQLAADLGLAANTVARAYRELEANGVISTHGRRGTFVRSTTLEDPPPATTALVRDFTGEARRRGLSLAEALALVERSWSKPPGSSGRVSGS